MPPSHTCGFQDDGSPALSGEARAALLRTAAGERGALRWVCYRAGQGLWEEQKPLMIVRNVPEPPESPVEPPAPGHTPSRLPALTMEIFGVIADYLDVWSLARARGCCRALHHSFVPNQKQRDAPCVASLRTATARAAPPYCALAAVWGRTAQSRRYVIVRQGVDLSSAHHPQLGAEQAVHTSVAPALCRRLRREVEQADPGCVVLDLALPPGANADTCADLICHRGFCGTPLEGFWAWSAEDGIAPPEVLSLC
eukprot:TRINITY_DN72397_c0_g1_i1.p1 TRINITY_DN72397_c0_g1~~TRINITY_DN72397_c0_g1_i1.p1  ORF type:complete len:278 (+),score=81.98 TRINITY_DN72397_c0_g1_i1:74-835(+)